MQFKPLETVSNAAPMFGLEPSQLYYLIREKVVPPGVVVRLGRQVRINTTKAVEWIENGGQALPGGWKREAKK